MAGLSVIIVDPYSSPKHGLTLAHDIAECAGLCFWGMLPSAPMGGGPCAIERPENIEDFEAVCQLLNEAQLKYRFGNI